MCDSIDDGRRKAKAAGGCLVAYLAVFLDDIGGGDFSTALQVNRIGKDTTGNGRHKTQNRNMPEKMRRGFPHAAILPRTHCRSRRSFNSMPNLATSFVLGKKEANSGRAEISERSERRVMR